MRILLVDDDDSLQQQVKRLLENQRYVVVTANDGDEALERIAETGFDVVILDIMMPKIDGLTALKQLRKAKIDTRVLLLTARGDAADRVNGLDLGADDYLVKPFSSDELLARVRALLRRSGSASETLLKSHDLLLDTVSRTVTSKGKPVELTPREFLLLEFLLYNKNRVLSRFSLAEHIWGDDFDPFSMSNYIDVHIKNLRRKIGDGEETRIIQAVRGIGYMIRDSE
jgi:DNA-binding response OmpR family regulator